MKKVLNTSKRIYRHQFVDEKGNIIKYVLEPNKMADVPDKIAEMWTRSAEVKLVGATSDEKDAEIAKLKKELEAQKSKAARKETAKIKISENKENNLGKID